ncbi:MAG TPA: hypothetical protein VE620_08410, partial [Myxococcales bacterium]|nr:hypothetical protein [Myxococcales bacterium]
LRLRFAVVGPLTPMAPGVLTSSSGYAQRWIFEPLLRTAADGSMTAGLASHFEMLSPSRARVELRPGASFSDGSPVTEDDVRISLGDGLQVSADGRAILIESRSGWPLEPILRGADIYKRADNSFIGSGPFRVVSQTPENLLVRRIRPEAGKVGEVLLTAFPTPRDTFARTLAGDDDLAVLQDPNQSEFFRGVDRVRVLSGRGANAIAIAMGLKHLAAPARKAIAAIIPNADLASLVFGSNCPPFEQPGNEDGALPRRSLEVAFLQNDLTFEHIALAVARALGNGAEVRPLAPTEALPLLKSQNFDLMIVRPLVWPPSAMAVGWASNSPYNQFGYSNPRVDAAIRSADWARALQELRDDPPVAFICTLDRLAVVDSRVKNPQLGPYGLFETVPEWEIAE